MNILITGASRGVGLELAKQYAEAGHTVYAVCRKKTPELEALPVHITDGIDLTNPEDLKKLPKVSLSLLINNAGLLIPDDLESVTYDSIRQQFEINALAPLFVTKALLPHLEKGAKVAMITSRMGSIAENTSGGRYGYRSSKTALNSLTKSLALDCKDVGFFLIHPGYVDTDMTAAFESSDKIPPATAAANIIKRLDGLMLEQTGTFWHAANGSLPW